VSSAFQSKIDFIANYSSSSACPMNVVLIFICVCVWWSVSLMHCDYMPNGLSWFSVWA